MIVPTLIVPAFLGGAVGLVASRVAPLTYRVVVRTTAHNQQASFLIAPSAPTARSSNLNPALLDAAVEACEFVLTLDRPADRALTDYFRARRQLGQNDRAFIAETIFAILRRKRSLEEVAGTDPRKLLLTALVRIRGLSLRELAPVLGSADQLWLQTMKGETRAAPSLAASLELPDWIAERLVAVIGEAETVKLGRSLLDAAPLDLRVNVHRADRAGVLAQLASDGIECAPTPYSPAGIRLAGKPALNRHPLFLNGTIEVQDEGSQLLCHLLAPRRGEMNVDFCAGAGGKTLALAAMMRSSGRVYAFDVSAPRLENLKPRLARSGLSNVHPQRIASEREPRVQRLYGKIDRVLVDAPCSGLGTLRRNPDLKWRQKPSDVEELVVKQAAILRAASALLKPGGRLVYATCSLLPEENEAIVQAFLAAHPVFKLVPADPILRQQSIDLPPSVDDFLRLWPHIHRTDGFFAAVMERLK